jgi:hypothetical protein
MRTIATLAAILVLPCALNADDTAAPSLNIAIAAPATEQAAECNAVLPAGAPTSSKYDTSVYHLKHAHARQVIPAVQKTICKLATEAAGEHSAHQVVSVAFMPTTSDDTLVAVCRREHAALVKQAIEACDVAKQYAVKVQLFEVNEDGQTVPVGSPSVVVGREGAVECKSETHGAIRVSLQISDAVTEAADVTVRVPAATDPTEETNCSGPDCGQPEATCSATKGACPVSCSGQADEACVCPACKEAASISSQCDTCSGTCEAAAATASNCKCGDACKCKGTCKCGSNEEVAESRSESSTSISEKGGNACDQCGEFTADEYRALVRILLTHWLQEHRDRTDGVAREDAAPTSAAESCSRGTCATGECPIAKSGVCPRKHLELEVELGCPAPVPSTGTAPTCSEDAPNPCPDPVVMGTPAEEGLFIRKLHICTTGSDKEDDDVAVAHVTDSENADCPCIGGCHAGDGQSVEPPALLTLSPLKEGSPSFGILISPEWQAELSKKFQGRRLSEIFEFHNGQDPGAVALRGLLAVMSTPESDSANSGVHHRNVIVLDVPERVRVFDGKCEADCASSASCANCHDSLRALLEDVLQSPILQSVNQTGHAEYDETVAKSPKELPSVAHSRIETTVVTYPLHDLILVDDAERPVFDTCTIIDHIQSAVAPETWAHPSVSIQLDQQTMSLVIRQTPEVHKKIETHLHDLRRLQFKRLSKIIEQFSAESESSDD